MNRVSDSVVDRLLSRVDEMWRPPARQLPEQPNRHQQLMNQAYHGYEKKAARVQATRALDKQQTLSQHQNFLEALSEAERIAVVFGNLNYQIENGGISQWIYNSYYKDTIEWLREYIERYGDRYPALKEVGDILTEIEGVAQNFGSGRYELEDLDRVVDDANNAISEEDWDALYDILGGTDYDRRRFDRDVEGTLKDSFSIDVEGEGEGPFSYVITLLDEVVEKSEPTFKDEDEAYQAADARTDELMRTLGDDDDNEALEKVKEMVKDEYSRDLAKHLERDIQHAFDRLDDQYSALSPKLLEQVSSLLRLEFSVSGDVRRFIVQAVEKARGLIRSGLKQARSGAANLLTKAAQTIKPQESVQGNSVSRLID